MNGVVHEMGGEATCELSRGGEGWLHTNRRAPGTPHFHTNIRVEIRGLCTPLFLPQIWRVKGRCANGWPTDPFVTLSAWKKERESTQTVEGRGRSLMSKGI